MNMNQRSLKSGILSFKQVLRASHLFCIADSTGQEGNTNIISIVLVRNKLSLELSHLVVFKSYSKFYKTLKKPYNACMALEFYSSNSEKSLLVQKDVLSLHPLEILIQGLKLTFLKPKHMWHKRANKDISCWYRNERALWFGFTILHSRRSSSQENYGGI